MKKSGIWLVLLALCMVLATGVAAADMTTVAVAQYLVCEPGTTSTPAYMDYSEYCGEGVTQEDFYITYACKSKGVTVDASGTITVDANVDTSKIHNIQVTYTPKVSGVGKSRTFDVRMYFPKSLLTGMSVKNERVYMGVNSSKTIQVALEGIDYYYVVSTLTYDSSVVEVSSSSAQFQGSYYININPVAVGDTKVTITAYNGVKTSFYVYVVAEPTQLTFTSDHFECYTGETLDLGIDLGNGAYGTLAYQYGSMWITCDGNFGIAHFQPDYRYVKFTDPGEYVLTMTVKGFTATTAVSVYDKANCASIGFASGGLAVGMKNEAIILKDAEGNVISRPVTLVEGADIAEVKYNRITVTGQGKITLSVQNADGSTTVQSFFAYAVPTEMTLNATELTMEIGETFELIPTFDIGSFDCTYKLDYDDPYPAYDLHPVRMEGNRIIAQAPGALTIIATYDDLTARCRVIVPDSDKAVRLVMPEERLAVGESFQVTVQDKTGKVYPGTYYSSDYAIELTEDGLITAVEKGAYDVRVRLEDGRWLYSEKLSVIQVPKWIQHPSLAAYLGQKSISLEEITSDVGEIEMSDVTVEVENEAIATFNGLSLTLHKVGITKVTLTAKNGGAQTTFTLTILANDDDLYLGNGTIEVPYGYVAYLPQVTDQKGRVIDMTWKITLDNPGKGNPEASGFVVEGDTIACIWPYASCEVTGTAKDGRTVTVAVFGYLIPEDIWFNCSECTLAIDEGMELVIEWDEPDAKTGEVLWIAENESIVSMYGLSSGTSKYITGTAPGVTTVVAMLSNGAYATCTVTVYDPNARTPGDANDDGSVDIADALLVLQYDAGWGVSLNHSNADVNADGVADIADALLLLQYDAGWDVTLK